MCAPLAERAPRGGAAVCVAIGQWATERGAKRSNCGGRSSARVESSASTSMAKDVQIPAVELRVGAVRRANLCVLEAEALFGDGLLATVCSRRSMVNLATAMIS